MLVRGLLFIVFCSVAFVVIGIVCSVVFGFLSSFVNFISYIIFGMTTCGSTHTLFFQDYKCFAIASSIFWSINFFSLMSSLCSLVIFWCLFIISVMSSSRLVRLFMMVLYLLKPVSIIHYLQHVFDSLYWFLYCLCFTYIYIDAYFFISINNFEFLHIFVLPDVAFFVVPGVVWSFITFFNCDVPSSLTATLFIICVTNSLEFFSAIRMYSYAMYWYIYIYIYIFECENHIVIIYLQHIFQFVTYLTLDICIQMLVYKVFK